MGSCCPKVADEIRQKIEEQAAAEAAAKEAAVPKAPGPPKCAMGVTVALCCGTCSHIRTYFRTCLNSARLQQEEVVVCAGTKTLQPLPPSESALGVMRRSLAPN